MKKDDTYCGGWIAVLALNAALLILIFAFLAFIIEAL